MMTFYKHIYPICVWGMDILETFPMVTAQRGFLIVAIDYFTKWIKAKPIAKITTKHVTQFLWESIIFRHGLPCILVTIMEGSTNEEFMKYCGENEIELCFKFVAHP